jgi:HSP20 family protein
MLALRQWSPFASMSRLHREIDQIFDRVFGDRRDWWTGVDSVPAFVPAIEAYVDGNQLHVRAELPGVDPKDVELTVLGNQFLIKGERKASKESQDEGYSLREFAYGRFERAVTLPEGAETEKINARYENGVLHITVPVKEAFAPKRVPIEVASGEMKSLKAA